MVVRAVYGDLILNWTLSTTTYPTIAIASTIITNYYKQTYTSIYGAGTYEDVTTDAIIDTETTKSTIITMATQCVNELALELKREMGPTKDEGYELARLGKITITYASREDENIEQTGDGYDA